MGIVQTGLCGLAAVLLTAATPRAHAQAPDPPPVEILRDLEYARVGDKPLLLDLYRPANRPGPLPVIVGIHGGGWAGGSKAGAQGAWLARHGYAVAVINYRLTGEAPFPAQIEDCKAAVRWLRAHAATYGLDPDRFGATGHSAGGHLTSLLATSGGVAEFDKGDHLDQSSRIQAACPLSGPTDLLQMDAHAPEGTTFKHDAPNSPEARLLGGPIQERRAEAARANPITYVDQSDPPFLLIHGDLDGTVPHHQAQLLFDALKTAGVPAHFHTIKGAGHGLGGGSDLNARIATFFDVALKSNGANLPPTGTSESQAAAVVPEPPATPGFLWTRVRDREDANKDGQVTRAEFQGPPRLFDRLDRNGDGLLSDADARDGRLPAAQAPNEPQP
jgi:acetyl esterase/lipase